MHFRIAWGSDASGHTARISARHLPEGRAVAGPPAAPGPPPTRDPAASRALGLVALQAAADLPARGLFPQLAAELLEVVAAGRSHVERVAGNRRCLSHP